MTYLPEIRDLTSILRTCRRVAASFNSGLNPPAFLAEMSWLPRAVARRTRLILLWAAVWLSNALSCYFLGRWLLPNRYAAALLNARIRL
jgi:hypothetical protein